MAAITPGNTTTEYNIAKWMVGIGTFLQAASVGLGFAFPAVSWIAPVVGVISGMLMSIAGALGYQVPRAALKTSALDMTSAAPPSTLASIRATIPPPPPPPSVAKP